MTYSDYDDFAWVYNRYWGDFSVRALPVLEQLVLPHIPCFVVWQQF
ncbi:MAG: hypothetical protein HXY40_18785 [Chloroflexi bacterium]|nr:hypothetical protein [Chloroflexota bacterium]